jgi:hypothetical protein
VYCTNRKSTVYLIGVDGDDDGKLTRVSADDGEDATTPWSVVRTTSHSPVNLSHSGVVH